MWIILEGKPSKEGIHLIYAGYKYNKKNILTFVMPRGVELTKVGDPYKVHFPDKYGNVCIRHVMHPEIIAQYFKISNCVNLYNQSRQFNLALEKQWITQKPYFRLYTTMIGMSVVDAWTIDRLTKKKSLNIKEYVDLMEKDMIQAASNYKIGSDISAKLNAISVSKIGGTSTSVSSLSLPERCFGTHIKLILGKVKQA